MRRRKPSWAVLVIAAFGTLTATAIAQEAAAPRSAESIIKGLAESNVNLRRAAAIGVWRGGREVQRQALPVLIDLLMKEKDGQVRLAVLDAVIDLGPEAAPAVPALVHTLKTNYGGQGKEELHQDYRSALALAAIGKPAVDALRGLLQERKESVRAEVIMGLGKIGPDAAAAVDELVPLLGDRSERLRREAATALGRIGSAAAAPLIAAARSDDPVTRAHAVHGLGQIAAPEASVQQAVLKCAGDLSPEVRAAALRSLSRLTVPDDDLVPVAEEGLRHDAEDVRLAAVDLMIARRKLLSRMAPFLESLVKGVNDGAARHAAFLLGTSGPEAAPRLIDTLRSDRARVEQVASALAQIGRAAVEPLAVALGDPEPRVRRGAALALGQIRPVVPGILPKLANGLRDADPDVKAAFLTAIGYLGRRAGEAVPAVRTMLREPSADIRLKAVEILAQSAPRDERLLADLTPLLDDADPRIQQQAIDVIRSLGPPGRSALSVVIGKLESPAPAVRLAAAEFIGSHGQAAAEAVPALTRILGDDDPKLQTVAAQTLGKLGKSARPAFDRLVGLLDARQPAVREAAIAALGNLELEAVVIRPHVARGLGDSQLEVRRAASRVIQRLGPDGAIFLPDVIVAAGSRGDSLRMVERSLRQFERNGPDPRSLPELVTLLGHEKEMVRLLAARFLGMAGDAAREAIPALEKLHDDKSAEVRKQAEAAIAKIKKGPAETPKRARAGNN